VKYDGASVDMQIEKWENQKKGRGRRRRSREEEVEVEEREYNHPCVELIVRKENILLVK
jgi:hypothetical protein